MDNLTYLFIAGIFFVVWSALFIKYGRSWQMPAFFIPISIGCLILDDYNFWYCILFLPMISLHVVDLNIILTKPIFNGWVAYLNYFLIVPFVVIFFFNLKYFTKNDSFFSSIFSVIFTLIAVIFIAKFWVSDVILLFINRLYLIDKKCLETAITHRYIIGSGRSKTYHAVVTGLGDIEISGFFYLYIGERNITAKDKLQLVIKKGWLGVEFITGFPKIISRR